MLTRNQLKQRKGRRFRMGCMIAAGVICVAALCSTGTKDDSCAPVDEVLAEPPSISEAVIVTPRAALPTPEVTPEAEVIEEVEIEEVEVEIRIMETSDPATTMSAEPIIEADVILESRVADEIPTYDLALSTELQLYTYDTCAAYGVEQYYELFLALMWSESSYRIDVISKTNDYGLMQINRGNHRWVSEAIGVTDFLDPEQNIEAGVYMLSDSLLKYDNVHKALMCYNMGPGGAAEAWAAGNYTSGYSRKIVGNWELILSGGIPE